MHEEGTRKTGTSTGAMAKHSTVYDTFRIPSFLIGFLLNFSFVLKQFYCARYLTWSNVVLYSVANAAMEPSGLAHLMPCELFSVYALIGLNHVNVQQAMWHSLHRTLWNNLDRSLRWHQSYDIWSFLCVYISTLCPAYVAPISGFGENSLVCLKTDGRQFPHGSLFFSSVRQCCMSPQTFRSARTTSSVMRISWKNNQ